MEIIRELTNLPNLSIALGFFDGLHLGHRDVIDGAIDFARSGGLDSAVVTFKNHPFCTLKHVTPKYILPQDDKYKILERVGLDYIIELDFESVCKMTPEEYLSDIIVKYFSPKAIVSGFNHHFGVNRMGNVKILSDYQDKYGYIYIATPPTTLFGDVISSTVIRNFVSSGNFSIANEMLGRRFYVKGKIVEGEKLGRTIGFPTANIDYPKDIIQPPFGVFKVLVELADGDIYHGIANFGTRPTVSSSVEPRLEVHLINFDGDLYGQNIKISFLKMIRPEYKFDSLEELRMQILLDIQDFKQ